MPVPALPFRPRSTIVATITQSDLTLVATSVHYLSDGDETSFFGWLRRLGCVASVRGDGHDLVIGLRSPPDDADLRELIALFFRYDVDMRQLARFGDRGWVRNPAAYWHRRVFGDLES